MKRRTGAAWGAGVCGALLAVLALATPLCPMPMAADAPTVAARDVPPCHGAPPAPADQPGKAPCCPLAGCPALTAGNPVPAAAVLTAAVPAPPPRCLAVAYRLPRPAPPLPPDPRPPPAYTPRTVVLLL